MHATLDLPGPLPEAGAQLPPFWHYIYFWDAQPPAALGRDGHPKTGGFIPDTGLPRRMWAGGSLGFHHPVLIGQPAEKRTTISDVKQKSGRTGPLALVTLSHEFVQEGRICITEQQNLIYREDPGPDMPKPEVKPAPTDESQRDISAFTPTLLFRYSALTFNGHRIHYDRDYCREVEGYPGLVVHGPLLAQLLINQAERLLGPLAAFSFRATAPLFDFETADICAKPEGAGLSLWVRGPNGRLCMTAEASGKK